MRNRRITDTDAAAVMGGTAPADRPDLADVATALSEFRGAVFMSLPQPSTELRERLDAGAPGGASTQLAHEGITRASAGGARRRDARRARRKVGAIIALAVVGSLVTVTSAGAAGVLPGGVQEVFDVVVQVAPEPPRDAPTVGTTVDTPNDSPAGEVEQPPAETAATPQPEDAASALPDSTPAPAPSVTPSAEPALHDNSDTSKDDKAKDKKDKDKKDKKDKGGAADE